MEFFYLRNPPRVASVAPLVVLNESALYDWRNVDFDEDGTFPFKFGKPLDIKVPIHGRLISNHPVPAVLVDTVGLFANTAIALRCEQLFGSQIQKFEVQMDSESSDPISVLNITNKVDCIDFDRSDIEMDTIVPNLCAVIRRLVLREEMIDPELFVFLLRCANDVIITSREGKQKFIAAGFPEDYFSTRLFA